MANKKDKSKHITFNSKAKTEEYKRVPGPAGMTESELKKAEWTGVRKDDMLCEWQFWILGKKEKTVSYFMVANDANALEAAHIEVFAMKPRKETFK